MPGTPIIYYGDEIAMGDNFYLGDRKRLPDPNAVEPDRTPAFPGQIRSSLSADYDDPEYHYKPLTWKISRRSLLVALVDTPSHRHAEKFQGVFGAARLNFFIQTIPSSCVPSPARGRNHSGDSESLALCAIGGTGSFTLLRLCADGSF